MERETSWDSDWVMKKTVILSAGVQAGKYMPSKGWEQMNGTGNKCGKHRNKRWKESVWSSVGNILDMQDGQDYE